MVVLKPQPLPVLTDRLPAMSPLMKALSLAKKGITGNVITKEIVVYGTVTGDIQTSSLEIRATGKITGTITTQTLLVETGGVYNGLLSMQQGEIESRVKSAGIKIKNPEAVGQVQEMFLRCQLAL
jgi:cytoskeletal protein CcmA (bactofilin family)